MANQDKHRYLLLSEYLTMRMEEEKVHKNGLIDLGERDPATKVAYEGYMSILRHDEYILQRLLDIVKNQGDPRIDEDTLVKIIIQLEREINGLKRTEEITDNESDREEIKETLKEALLLQTVLRHIRQIQK